MNENKVEIWKFDYRSWLGITIILGVLFFVFFEALVELERVWSEKEEYSYGYIIPFVTLYFIWLKKDKLEKASFTGSWLGVILVLVGFFLFGLAELSAIYLIMQYSLIIVLAGFVLSCVGWDRFKTLIPPLIILLFMIPLPRFFLQEISTFFQLISSFLGVWVIRLFNISVYLEGNVIDLGIYKLQVVEACNGLRYLFPFMTLGFISMYFYKAAFWKRGVIFLSTIPITILMNSFRIGVIGVMVEYRGPEMAEGFLHDFEGWIVFMVCITILVGEMFLLARVGGNPQKLNEVFVIDSPLPTNKNAVVRYHKTTKSFITSAIIIICVAILLQILPEERVEKTQKRTAFMNFPEKTGDWEGRSDKLETIYLDALKLSDYLMMNYKNSSNESINFYIAYYESQKKGQSAHSPKTCIPGGGWQIKTLEQIPMDLGGTGSVNTNRLVIQLGDTKQVVYYWFQQRGRNITNEYLVKWYIFWDALTKNRTDGALIRVTTMVSPGEDIDLADKRIIDFVKASYPKLQNYIPE